MGTTTDIRNKTEQHVLTAIASLKAAVAPMSYDDLRVASGGKRHKNGLIVGGTSYDVLLYVTTTLIEVGLVEKTQVVEGPGRPRVYFSWVGNAKGSRVKAA